MAFPVAPFGWNPQVEISDEEYKLFHSIDRQLMKTLIDLGRNSFDAITAVAFLLYLERSRLGAKAVEKVLTQNWPIHLIDMLADQVVALLEWLKNPTLVWEVRGDISLIQELCTPEVGFVNLYKRRLEILKETTEIVNEMAATAFKDMFPDGVVDRSVQDGVGQGSGGGAVHVPREIENMSHGGVQVGSGSGCVQGPRVPESNVGGEFPVFGNFGSGSGINVGGEFPVFGNFGSGSGSGYVHGPRVPESNVGGEFPVFGDFGPGSGGGAVNVPREHVNRDHDGVQIGSAGGHVHGPREVESSVGGEFIFGDFGSGSGGGAELVNRHLEGVQTGSAGGYVHGPQEVESNVGGETAAAGVPVYGPRELRSYNHNGAGFEVRGRYVQDPRELINMNHHVAGYGSTAGGLVHGRMIPDSRQLENRNIGIRVSIPTVPVPNPQEIQANIHNGVGYQAHQRLIYDPRRLNSINRNGLGYGPASRLVRVHPEPEIMNGAGAGGFGTVGGIVPVHPGRLGYGMPRGLVQVHGEPVNMNGDGAGGFGTVGGLVQVHGEPENLNEDGTDGEYDDEPIPDDEGQILPNVPYGPRMGRYVENDGGNPGNSRRLEMMNSRRPFSENELAVILSGLNVREEETHVHDDDKTVFLTFSRGYPITEPEIWGFFTRRLGNFIKAIHFEEVPEGAQPLYARMVARNSSILPLICDINSRTRYVINGKHVWAKKYVRKHHTPPPRLSTSRADPPPSP